MSSNTPDYSTLPVPDDKPPTEYTWAERRSELYNLIEEAGHPRNLERTQEQLGKRYGVTQRQISDDVQAIREFEGERVGKDARAETEFVCAKAVRSLLDEGKYKEAADLQLSYFEWLQDAGVEERAADKLDIGGQAGNPLEVTINRRETDDSNGDE